MRRVPLLALLVAPMLSAHPAQAVAQAKPARTAVIPPAKPVRLVMALVLDQFRPDYLDRWKGEFTGGLAKLLARAVFYRHGEQDRAMTETAPGHSTMLSGRSPASTGILSDNLGSGDPQSALLGATGTGGGASPRRFIGSTLVDWMIARDSATKVLSISIKDRSAILTVGRAKVPTFWYNGGRFTTSKYYMDSLPPWLFAWNAADPIAKLKGMTWSLSRDAASYPEVDDRPFERGGTDRVFPHLLPDDWAKAASAITNFPISDSLTMDVALRGVRAMNLGQRNGTDLLALSLSATDYVGHEWGPGSREMHDHLLKLDRWLGVFLDSMATIVPQDQMIVTLTADHGGQDWPEAGKGIRLSLRAQVTALNAWAKSRWRIDLGAGRTDGLLYGDFAMLKARGINVDSLADAVAAEVRAMPGVRKVYTPKTLARDNSLDAMRWKRALPPAQSWLIAASVEEGVVADYGSTSTGHGTTNVADVEVPLMFWVPGLAPARIERHARTVDLGTTLAALIGVKPTEKVEGVILPEIVHRAKPK